MHRIRVNLLDKFGWFRYEFLSLVEVWSKVRGVKIGTDLEMGKNERIYFFTFDSEEDMLLFLLTFSEQI